MNLSNRPPVAAVLAVIIPLLLASCAAERENADPAGNVEFEVIADYLGDPYRNEALRIGFRPPLGWEQLSADQRDQVSAALLEEQASDRYSLDLVDVFFQTSTLSFAALSRVTLGGEPVLDAADYANSFEATLEPSDDDELTSRASFVVNDLPLIQFRHRLSDRITFTLIFSAADGEVAQLDYSIPVPAYEDESIKLESSIGSLHPLEE